MEKNRVFVSVRMERYPACGGGSFHSHLNETVIDLKFYGESRESRETFSFSWHSSNLNEDINGIHRKGQRGAYNANICFCPTPRSTNVRGFSLKGGESEDFSIIKLMQVKLNKRRECQWRV